MVHQTIATQILAADTISQFIETKLRPLLPYALPLYRRCQFHLNDITKHEEQTLNGEVWFSVYRSDANQSSSKQSTDQWLQTWLATSGRFSSCASTGNSTNNNLQDETWLAAYIDLSNPGETQIWLFGSWESERSQTTPPTVKEIRIDLFQSLFNHVRVNHIPKVSISPTRRWQSLLDSGKLISVPYKRSKVLFGAVSEQLWPYLEDGAVSDHAATPQPAKSNKQPRLRRTRYDLGYLKYIIPPPTSTSEPIPPPPGFHYGPLSRKHLQTMLDRSAIPRTLELLQSLVSTGLFPLHTQDPISWGLLSKDASLSSLHTEPDYRGRGLAEHICRKLATSQPDIFNSNTPPHPVSLDGIDYSSYLHADVSESNIASRRVCEKLGGTTSWKVGWIEVDLGETSTTHN